MCPHSLQTMTPTWLTVAVCVAMATLAAGQMQPRYEMWDYLDYPDPWWRPLECGREGVNRSAVCDPNAILTQSEASELDRLIASVYDDTRCGCTLCQLNKKGYVIRMALMPRYKSIVRKKENALETLRDAQLFAYLLSQRWQLHGHCNETVLILYSRDDNTLFTLTWPEARRKLTDELVLEITSSVRGAVDDRRTRADAFAAMIRDYKMVFLDTYAKPNYDRAVGDGGRSAAGSLSRQYGLWSCLPLAVLSVWRWFV